MTSLSMLLPVIPCASYSIYITLQQLWSQLAGVMNWCPANLEMERVLYFTFPWYEDCNGFWNLLHV